MKNESATPGANSPAPAPRVPVANPSDSWDAVSALRANGILQTLDADAIDASPFCDGWVFCANGVGAFHLVAMTRHFRCYHLVTTTRPETIRRWWLELTRRQLLDRSLNWFSTGARL